MKRFLTITLSAIMLTSSLAYAGEIGVQLNGQAVEFKTQEPVIVDGRTLIPLRSIFEEMGYTISWNADTKTATLQNDTTTIEITANADTIIVNGENVKAEVPAQIINNTMLLPLRAIAELSGATVDWDGETKTVSIAMDIETAQAEAEQKVEDAEEAERLARRAEKDALADEYPFSEFYEQLLYTNTHYAGLNVAMDIVEYADYKIDKGLEYRDAEDLITGVVYGKFMFSEMVDFFKKEKAPESCKELKNLTIEFLEKQELYYTTLGNYFTGQINDDEFDKETDKILEELEEIFDALKDAADNLDEASEKQNESSLTLDDITDSEKALLNKYNKSLLEIIDKSYESIRYPKGKYNNSDEYIADIKRVGQSYISSAKKSKESLNKLTPPEFCADQNECVEYIFTLDDALGNCIIDFANGKINNIEFLIKFDAYTTTKLDLIYMFTGEDYSNSDEEEFEEGLSYILEEDE